MKNAKLLLWVLIALFIGLCLVMLVFSGEIYALMGLISLPLTLAVPSAPFILLQLALCKYCKGWLLPKLPLMVSAFGCTVGFMVILESSNWEALTGFFILLPSLLGLTGSGLGWAIWRYAQKRLH